MYYPPFDSSTQSSPTSTERETVRQRWPHKRSKWTGFFRLCSPYLLAVRLREPMKCTASFLDQVFLIRMRVHDSATCSALPSGLVLATNSHLLKIELKPHSTVFSRGIAYSLCYISQHVCKLAQGLDKTWLSTGRYSSHDRGPGSRTPLMVSMRRLSLKPSGSYHSSPLFI